MYLSLCLCYYLLECWTDWLNRDIPTGTGDWETVSEFRKGYRRHMCPSPTAIEVASVDGISLADTGNVFHAWVAGSQNQRLEGEQDEIVPIVIGLNCTNKIIPTLKLAIKTVAQSSINVVCVCVCVKCSDLIIIRPKARRWLKVAMPPAVHWSAVYCIW